MSLRFFCILIFPTSHSAVLFTPFFFFEGIHTILCTVYYIHNTKTSNDIYVGSNFIIFINVQSINCAWLVKNRIAYMSLSCMVDYLNIYTITISVPFQIFFYMHRKREKNIKMYSKIAGKKKSEKGKKPCILEKECF